jgi:plastocyanin
MPLVSDYPSMNPRSRLSRRAALRLGAAVPLVGLVTAAGRAAVLGSIWSATHAAHQDAATPEAGPAACAATRESAAASPVASPPAAVTIQMTTQLRFDPDHVTIKVGETITWVNDSILPHTATGDPAQNPVASSHPDYVQLPDGAEPWGSKLLQPGESYSHTFLTPGEYHYICIPHVLSGMRGTITVEC